MVNFSMQRFLRWFFISAVIVFGSLLILVLSLPYFTPPIERYHHNIEQKISESLKENVQIRDISLSWRGVNPVLNFKNIDILDDHNLPLMSIRQMKIGINIPRSLLSFKIEPNDIDVSGMHLYLKEDQNGILHINNISALEADLHSEKNEKLKELIHWFLLSGSKKLTDINVQWISKDNVVFPIYIEEFKGDSGFLSHQYHGRLRLANSQTSYLQANIFGFSELPGWLKGNIDMSVRELPAQQFFPLLFNNQYQTMSGKITLEGRLGWSPATFTQMSSKVIAQDIDMKVKDSKQLTINKAEGNIFWYITHQGWGVSFNQMAIQLNNELLPIHNGRIEVQNSPGMTKQFLQTNSLPLQKLSQFALEYHLLPPHLEDELFKINPQGDINNFSIKHEGSNWQLSSPDYEISGELKNISFAEWQKYPGVKNLSGNINITPRSGFLNINAKDLQFHYSRLFREVLFTQKAMASISWKQSRENWIVSLKQLNVSNAEANAQGKAKIIIPTNGQSPSMQTKIQFNVTNLHKPSPYLPVSIMPKPLVTWLDKAFKDGNLSNGEFILEGALKDFPFSHKPGKFIVQAKMNDVSLRYLPDWPVIAGINGSIRFDKHSLSAQASSALFMGAHLVGVTATIPDLKHAKLFLKGHAASSAQVPLHLNKQTFAKLANTLGDLNVQGALQLGLKMEIPIETGTSQEALSLSGQLHVNNTDIDSAKAQLNLKNLNGAINFTENSITISTLRGVLLNQPINLNVTTSEDRKFIVMNFDGRLSPAELNSKFELPIFKNIMGTTSYYGLMQIAREKEGVNTSLTIYSNLNGLSVNLPSPFDKKENAPMKSYLHIKYMPKTQSTIKFFYGDQLSGIFNFINSKHHFSFDRGALQLGKAPATLPLQKGLQLEGELPEFNLTQWVDFIKTNNLHNTKKSFDLSTIFSQINLKVHKLGLNQMQLNAAQITAKPEKNNWTVAIDSPKLQGQLVIPNKFPQLPIQGKLEHLTIDDFNTTQNLRPKDIPPINLVIDDLKYKEKNFKHLQLALIPQGSHLYIKQLNINEPMFHLNLSGWWRELKDHSQNTSLRGQLKSSNIGAVLNQWQITDNMVQGFGTMNFNLSWQNSPMSPRVSTMNGNVDLDFQSGRIIHLTQQATMGLGVGRVLNLLSLQTLPRRLKLDFSDITAPGFPYDEMKGNFKFNNGSVDVGGAYLEGPLAKVRTQGKIGLENKDYNLQLAITPNVTSSLPIVATLTAGPIAGVITWVADKILSRQVKKITEIHYNVTGSWVKPNLVQTTSP